MIEKLLDASIRFRWGVVLLTLIVSAYGLTQLLKQKQYSPMPFEEQTASIWAGTNGFLDAVPAGDVSRYEEEMLSYLRAEHIGILNDIRDTKDLKDGTRDQLKAALETFAKQFA